ncbi:MAG: response regulator [Gammaproteobacteria bacterium]|nr:response regulator [Gammaproteobacteria bacterium]
MAKILAVDDSQTIRNIIQKILEGVGHAVTTADDGPDALEIARKEQFDLVLSDINMPKMSGISLLSKLRRLPEYEHTPILMVTTETGGYKKEKSKSSGASGWIQKPFTEETLLKAVKKIIG